MGAEGLSRSPRLEALERRVLLSAYALNQAAYFGANAGGLNPESTLVADSNGNFYGTTSNGGAYGGGSVFEVVRGSSAITALASFNGTDGQSPYAGVSVDASGNLFGTTTAGGASGLGTVFEIARGSNAITVLASFDQVTGESAYGGVTLDASGNLYGTTNVGGGASDGTVFELAAGSDAITVLASFYGFNGAYPHGPLTVDAGGNLYGTTQGGGPNDCGTVFEMAGNSHAITTLATFNGPGALNPSGSRPAGGVTIDASGNLFGTTSDGGTNQVGGQGRAADLLRGPNQRAAGGVGRE